MLDKIISGGQTGVDRAALDTSLHYHIKHHGWCPKGRRAEDGKINENYHLQETETEDYSVRTKLNIRDSDGTLVLLPNSLFSDFTFTDGTKLTIEEAENTKKPCILVNLTNLKETKNVIEWIKENDVKILNVAGPRESSSPGIYKKSFLFLSQLIKEISTIQSQ